VDGVLCSEGGGSGDETGDAERLKTGNRTLEPPAGALAPTVRLRQENQGVGVLAATVSSAIYALFGEDLRCRTLPDGFAHKEGAE
jgi:hypothetical protein